MDYLTLLLARYNQNPLAMTQFVVHQVNTSPNYLAAILPPKDSTTDQIIAGTVTPIITRARATAVDSPFAKGGKLQVNNAGTSTVQFTIETSLTQSDRKNLLETARIDPNKAVEEAVNYLLTRGLAESLRLSENYVRAKILTSGKRATIKENGVTHIVDTGLRDENVMDRKSVAKGDWTGASSKMWEDVVAHGQRTRNPGRVIALMSQDMWQAVRYNAANKIRVLETTNSVLGDPYATAYRVGKVSETLNGSDVQADETFTVVVLSATEVTGSGQPGESNWDDKVITLLSRGDTPYVMANGEMQRGPLGYLHRGPNLHNPVGAPGIFTEMFRPEANSAEIRARGSEELAGWINNYALVTVLQHA